MKTLKEVIKELPENINCRNKNELTKEYAKTKEQLGDFHIQFGYVLEDRAMKSLPKILKKDYNKMRKNFKKNQLMSLL